MAQGWWLPDSATFWPHLSSVALILRLPRGSWPPGHLPDEALRAWLCLLMFSLTALSWAQGLAADVMILELSGNYGSITTANRPEPLYRSRAAPAQPGERAAPPLGADARQRVSQRT